MAKETHLQMIQAVVARMAQNSFALKGWAVTLVAAVFALAGKDTNAKIGFVCYLPALMFWFLDAYYLRQERLFRGLYNRVRLRPEAEIDYSMNVFDMPAADGKAGISFAGCLMSVTEAGFYGPLILVITVGCLIVGTFHAWK